MSTIKNTTVYRVQFGTTEYMTKVGKTADQATWSLNKADAVRLTNIQAYNIASRFNRHLDRGVAKRYGWGQ